MKSLNGTDDFGKPYQKSEEELKEDIEFHLELEQYSAWHATTQASTPLSTTEARLILAAKGISTSTESIVLTNSDLMPIQEGWGPSLCGMFAGRFPGKEAVYAMVKRWQVPVKVAFHKKGWIIFSFKKAVDLETVREKGPHSIFGIPLVLEPTPEDFDLKGKMKVNVAIWIRIPDLPLTLWNRSAIEKIATTVGTPVMVDECTILRETLDGPRVQVIINVLDEPRKNIEIVLPDGVKFTQEIVYESLPKYCRICQEFGHYGAGCPGPEEREKIRRANMQRQRPYGRFPSRTRDQSRGRNPSRGRGEPSTGPSRPNPLPVQNGQPRDNSRPRKADPRAARVDPKVWQPSGKVFGKIEKLEQKSAVVSTSNQFEALAQEEAGTVSQQDPRQELATAKYPITDTTYTPKAVVEARISTPAKKKNEGADPNDFMSYEEAKQWLELAGYEDPDHELFKAGFTNTVPDKANMEEETQGETEEILDSASIKGPVRVPLRDPEVDQEQGEGVDMGPFPPLDAAVAQGSGRKGRKMGPKIGKGSALGTGGVHKKGSGAHKDRERSKSRGHSKSRDPNTDNAADLGKIPAQPKGHPSTRSSRPLDESLPNAEPSQ